MGEMWDRDPLPTQDGLADYLPESEKLQLSSRRMYFYSQPSKIPRLGESRPPPKSRWDVTIEPIPDIISPFDGYSSLCLEGVPDFVHLDDEPDESSFLEAKGRNIPPPIDTGNKSNQKTISKISEYLVVAELPEVPGGVADMRSGNLGTTDSLALFGNEYTSSDLINILPPRDLSCFDSVIELKSPVINIIAPTPPTSISSKTNLSLSVEENKQAAKSPAKSSSHLAQIKPKEQYETLSMSRKPTSPKGFPLKPKSPLVSTSYLSNSSSTDEIPAENAHGKSAQKPSIPNSQDHENHSSSLDSVSPKNHAVNHLSSPLTMMHEFQTKSMTRKPTLPAGSPLQPKKPQVTSQYLSSTSQDAVVLPKKPPIPTFRKPSSPKEPTSPQSIQQTATVSTDFLVKSKRKGSNTPLSPPKTSTSSSSSQFLSSSPDKPVALPKKPPIPTFTKPKTPRSNQSTSSIVTSIGSSVNSSPKPKSPQSPSPYLSSTASNATIPRKPPIPVRKKPSSPQSKPQIANVETNLQSSSEPSPPLPSNYPPTPKIIIPSFTASSAADTTPFFTPTSTAESSVITSPQSASPRIMTPQPKKTEKKTTASSITEPTISSLSKQNSRKEKHQQQQQQQQQHANVEPKKLPLKTQASKFFQEGIEDTQEMPSANFKDSEVEASTSTPMAETTATTTTTTTTAAEIIITAASESSESAETFDSFIHQGFANTDNEPENCIYPERPPDENRDSTESEKETIDTGDDPIATVKNDSLPIDLTPPVAAVKLMADKSTVSRNSPAKNDGKNASSSLIADTGRDGGVEPAAAEEHLQQQDVSFDESSSAPTSIENRVVEISGAAQLQQAEDTETLFGTLPLIEEVTETSSTDTSSFGRTILSTALQSSATNALDLSPLPNTENKMYDKLSTHDAEIPDAEKNNNGRKEDVLKDGDPPPPVAEDSLDFIVKPESHSEKSISPKYGTADNFAETLTTALLQNALNRDKTLFENPTNPDAGSLPQPLPRHASERQRRLSLPITGMQSNGPEIDLKSNSLLRNMWGKAEKPDAGSIKSVKNQGSGSLNSLIGSKSTHSSISRSRSQYSILGPLPDHFSKRLTTGPSVNRRSSSRRSSISSAQTSDSGSLQSGSDTASNKLARQKSTRQPVETTKSSNKSLADRNSVSPSKLPTPVRNSIVSPSLTGFRLQSLKMLVSNTWANTSSNNSSSSGSKESKIPVAKTSTSIVQARAPLLIRSPTNTLKDQTTSPRLNNGGISGSLGQMVRMSGSNSSMSFSSTSKHSSISWASPQSDSGSIDNDKDASASLVVNNRRTSFAIYESSESPPARQMQRLSEKAGNGSPVSMPTTPAAEKSLLLKVGTQTRHGRSPSGNGRETQFSIRPTVQLHHSQQQSQNTNPPASVQPPHIPANHHALGSESNNSLPRNKVTSTTREEKKPQLYVDTATAPRKALDWWKEKLSPRRK
ncbi:hypothetical protein BDR26DRAFT_645761, partial [Obelidium mucronatum]